MGIKTSQDDAPSRGEETREMIRRAGTLQKKEKDITQSETANHRCFEFVLISSIFRNEWAQSFTRSSFADQNNSSRRLVSRTCNYTTPIGNGNL